MINLKNGRAGVHKGVGQTASKYLIQLTATWVAVDSTFFWLLHFMLPAADWISGSICNLVLYVETYMTKYLPLHPPTHTRV